ncbi:right-handed parallel beta-helix repeat-containing protein [Sedimentisphaera salicampi]|uniref:right-handed parallel beta-helix repeat-containing protein n=1 Tax=Sedimentisphaera salicampi TaxID=1941349 RepID=UPI000B9C5333|nr:right-handed parallel beta-helix repeat-containing protein [Sedimentisphaera salicampi]OXU14549.1 Lambda-carrageenase precursor [Sedimentisphaera salicampi]
MLLRFLINQRFVFLLLCIISFQALAQSAFQPYNTGGDNIIHVTAADFDDVGVKDYVVCMSVHGKIKAYDRPALHPQGGSPLLWEYSTPVSFNIMIKAAQANTQSPGEEILIPGTDGKLRILSSQGSLLSEWAVGSGAMYCADTGQTSSGQTVIITGGVDGNVYFLDESGNQLAAETPENKGVVRRVVTGDYDGSGGEEAAVFYAKRGFAGNRYIEIYDLDTFARPSYSQLKAPLYDDAGPTVAWGYVGMGWTDKQIPWAYDMDGDGDEEIAAHWGVLHPESGSEETRFTGFANDGELLYLDQDYGNAFEQTPTGRYLLQQGIPGDFKDGAEYPDTELFTVYGDDLYLVNYDTSKSPETNRCKVSDYTNAHPLYHFTDAARLEDRSGGLDKIVLAGPITGDDHFYVVDLSGDDWKQQSQTIDGRGVLGEVDSNLDQLSSSLNNFSGQQAPSGRPIWFIHYFESWLGWEMTPENIQAHGQQVEDAMLPWKNMLGGDPQRVVFAASHNPKVIGPNGGDPDVTPEGMVAYCEELASRGVHFCLKIGHGANLYMSAENLADCYEASVVDGECYMMARTKELHTTNYIDAYKPHMDAVLQRAQQIGEEPAKIMLCGKGAIFSAMTPSQASTYFPAYKDILMPGVENSNVNAVDLSFSERVGLWMSGQVESWGCNLAGDWLASNRIAEWGGMRNGHIVLRHLLSQLAMGAEVFRFNSVTASENPIYKRGIDPNTHWWSDTYRQGMWNFLKIVESGAFPSIPSRQQIKGISPVAAAAPEPDYAHLRKEDVNHDWNNYSPDSTAYVINNLECWNAYTDVPGYDLTSIFFNTKRRWDNFFPTSASGFPLFVPYKTKQQLEAMPWCRKAYQTDGVSWDDYGRLMLAETEISSELQAQRTNMPFYVENECFWQVIESESSPDLYYAMLMDSAALSPEERDVKLKLGSETGAWAVYDQLGSQQQPLGELRRSSDEVPITVPAGSARLLTIQADQSGGADIYEDGFVDHTDLMMMVYQWLGAPMRPSADIAPESGDDFVNLLDFSALAESWLILQPGTEYYLDSENGDDSNSGLTPQSAWKTLSKAGSQTYEKGDSILLKSGQTFEGSLQITSSGTEKAPIVISSWSDGDKPVIDSAGFFAGIEITDSSFVEVSGIEITSDGQEAIDPRAETQRYGVYAFASGSQVQEGIKLSDLYIHDIFAEVAVSSGGRNPTSNMGKGIEVLAQGWGDPYFDGITIENCRIETTGHYALGVHTRQTSDQSRYTRNVEILNNSLADIGGPGIQPGRCVNVLVRGNTVDASGAYVDPRMHGRGSGIWPWSCHNVLIEKNSFMHARGKADSCGAHIDFNCSDVVVQYNFSMDNEGGFIEILGNNYNCAYRYNVSVNDGFRVKGQNGAVQEGKTIFAGGYVGSGNAKTGPFNTYIYNNTIYTKGDGRSCFRIEKTTDGLLIANNIFCMYGDTSHDSGDSGQVSNVIFENNMYIYQDIWPASMPIQDSAPIYGWPVFTNLGGTDPLDYIPTNTSEVQDAGIEIPKLPQDSVGLEIGLEVQEDFRGNPIVGLPDLGAFEIGQ